MSSNNPLGSISATTLGVNKNPISILIRVTLILGEIGMPQQYKRLELTKEDREKLDIEMRLAEAHILDVWEGSGKMFEVTCGEWIVKAFKERTKVMTYKVDVGYDVSTYPRKTEQHFVLSDYTTVESFLDEHANETIATYCSGSGLACATLDDILQRDLEDAGYCWLKEQPFYGEYGYLNDVEEEDDYDIGFYLKMKMCDWIEEFKQRSMAVLINRDQYN